MKISDFDFELPAERIARFPLENRSDSKLLQVTDQGLSHSSFKEVVELLQPNDLLVFNNTKVIPARIFGRKTTGGRVELLVERVLDQTKMLAQVHVSKPPKVGDKLLFDRDIEMEVLGRSQQFYELQCKHPTMTLLEVIEAIGTIPLPPYMHREAQANDIERYQTVYAQHKGSVAAPTAGLHFDKELLAAIARKDVSFGYVTLHIGAGTFAPIRVQDIYEHKMHAEYIEVSQTLCDQIKNTKNKGGRVIAVGTTTIRSLETASQSGEIQPYYGDTSIFIYPGYEFHGVDALITNLHLPQSTLMMLVCAFGGYENIMAAYQCAIKENYRFYSYGDAMWIESKTYSST